jgi:hypothetical protein
MRFESNIGLGVIRASIHLWWCHALKVGAWRLKTKKGLGVIRASFHLWWCHATGVA